MAGEANGLATVLQLLGARGAVEGDGGSQSEMFENEAAPLPLATKATSGPQGGRPAGARNRSTEEWCRYLLGRYRSPLTGLAELYSRPLGDLVDELQAIADRHAVEERTERVDGTVITVRHAARVNPLEVLRLQVHAKTALAPYLHKQQPKALEIDARPRGVVLIGELAGVEDGSDELALPLPKDEGNQGGDVGARSQSDDKPGSDAGIASARNGLEYRDD